MYCPHCGTETAQGLNYCNRCGGNLSLPAQGAETPALSTGKVWAAGVTTMLLIVMGLGVMLAAVTDLAHSGLPPDVIKTAIFCGTIILICGVAFIGWLWTRVLGLSRRADSASYLPPRIAHTSELGPARAGGALPEAQTYPISSVTEHTTRTLEHIRK